MLSNLRYSGERYEPFDQARRRLRSIRVYYLEPRHLMRQALPPAEVDDIGPRGERLAAFLYRLQRERSGHFETLQRLVGHLVGDLDAVRVWLDERRGRVDFEAVLGGTAFSARLLSEGTLRVLGVGAMALNPWSGGLVAFEEPDSGVHPRRMALLAELFVAMARGQAGPGRQVLLTTHSPAFAAAVVAAASGDEALLQLYAVRRVGDRSVFRPVRLPPAGPLPRAWQALAGELTDQEMLQVHWMRGLLDG